MKYYNPTKLFPLNPEGYAMEVMAMALFPYVDIVEIMKQGIYGKLGDYAGIEFRRVWEQVSESQNYCGFDCKIDDGGNVLSLSGGVQAYNGETRPVFGSIKCVQDVSIYDSNGEAGHYNFSITYIWNYENVDILGLTRIKYKISPVGDFSPDIDFSTEVTEFLDGEERWNSFRIGTVPYAYSVPDDIGFESYVLDREYEVQEPYYPDGVPDLILLMQAILNDTGMRSIFNKIEDVKGLLEQQRLAFLASLN